MIYLAAPYSDPSAQVVDSRMEVVRRVSNYLNESKRYCITPLVHHFLGMRGDWTVWREYSHRLLSGCDSMIVLQMPGWEKSVGVQGEIKFAEMNNIPIEYYDAEAIEKLLAAA